MMLKSVVGMVAVCLAATWTAAGCGGGRGVEDNSDELTEDAGTQSENPSDSGQENSEPDSGLPSSKDSGVEVKPDSGMPSTPDAGVALTMSFFVTSQGNGKGGDFRATPNDTDGLAGADAFCKSLAAAVNPALGAKTWRAYLSTTTVDARDRIGTGPWRNSKGVIIATSVAQLHEEGGLTNVLSGANSLDEKGVALTNGQHDILTGSQANGRLFANRNCNNWTSSAGTGVQAQVGHTNRMGGGSTSWNSVHPTQSCSAVGVTSGGGRGSLYCFALEGG